jgi:MIP family channel proteins
MTSQTGAAGRTTSTDGRGAGGPPPGSPNDAQPRGLYGSRTGVNMAAAAAAETIGTAILIFGGTGVATAAAIGRPVAGPIYDSLATPLAFGIALLVVVAAIGHVSGGHVNPAVTLALAVTGKFPWRYVPAYLVAQLVGAVLGALGTWVAFGGPGRDVAHLAATTPSTGVGALQALAVEAIVTFVLVFTVIAVATDDRVADAVAPIAVGAALAVGVFVAGPVTGGAVNPARALGPMIVAGQFTAWWVYLVGPIVGGIIAAVIYDRFVRKADAP